MRVTKTIREHIENQVKGKYAERIAAVSKDYEEEKRVIQEKCEQLVKESNEKIKDFISENYPHWTKDVAKIEPIRYYCLENLVMYADIRSEKSILNSKVKEHIMNIILTLELGGSKKELEDMLNNIK